MQLRQADTSIAKERLQVLYWLKQEKASSVCAIARAISKHRNKVQTRFSMYRNGGIEAMLEIKKSPGGVRVIPLWTQEAKAQAVARPQPRVRAAMVKCSSTLAETLGIEAEYHAVYQMTRYRLKAKLKVARPQNTKQDPEQREALKKTWQTTSIC